MELTLQEQKDLKALLSEIKSSGHSFKSLAKMLKEHNHDNLNSALVKTLNINGGGGKVLKINDNSIYVGLGIKLRNSPDGLPNLGDDDLGTIFYNTTYDEVWVWRYNGVDGNEWKALDYVA
jgi:hypothetical protein